MNQNPIDELTRIDPIDAERLQDSWGRSDAKRQVFNEIVGPGRSAKPVKGRAPRRALRLALGVAIVAAVLVLSQGLMSEGDRAFAVKQLPNGVLEIDASTQLRDGEALAAELREYGIDVDIRTVPSSPSVVGGVAVFAPGGGDYIPEGLSYGGPPGTPETFKMLIDPAVFREKLTIELHVAPRDGERYLLAASVFEPGEVLGDLHCALGEPIRTEELIPYVDELELTPLWLVITPTDDPSITNSEQVSTPPPGRVLSAHPHDPSTVEFQVLADGVTLPDFYFSEYSGSPCTPAAASAWER